MDKISKRIAALVFAAAFVLSIVAASFPAVGAYEVEPESSEGDSSTSSQIDESLLVKDLGLDLHFFCERTDDAGRTLATLNKEEFPNIGAFSMGSTMVLEQEPNENLFYSLDVPRHGQITFTEVPVGTRVTIAEQSDGYTVTVNGTEGDTEFTGTVNGDTTVTFGNRLDMTVPTSAFTDGKSGLVVIAIVSILAGFGFGFALAKRKRKHRKNK